MGDHRGGAGRDFFVSYTSADRQWAQWIGWQLKQAGYQVVLQAWDMVPGTDFVHEMQRAATTARRTVAVLSPSYFSSKFGEAEWRVAFANDPTGEKRLLIPVRVADVDPPGLLATRVYIDLIGKGQDAARAALLEGVRGREAALPAEEPAFPGEQAVAAVETVGAHDEEPRFPGDPRVWNVPFRPNPDFTGREQILARLAEELGRGAAAVTQALQGGGGVGKTALAVEYAYRHRSEFDTVWWVRAEEPATLVDDYAALADALGLPEAGQADQQLAARSVRRWLEGNDRWLLVLDNAQAPDTPTGLEAPLARLVDLIPQVLHGQVLVTSRDASWEQRAALAELEVFSPEEAIGFLLARSGSSDRSAAAQIGELLGLLPLALEQAGAYVRETRLGLGDYLERLRQFPALTLARGRPRDRDPTDTVSSTFQVSVEQVRPVPGAVALLEVCAFLSSEAIPRDLFTVRLDPPAADLKVLANDPFALDAAVGALRRFGLAKADAQTLTVHRLLQQVTGDNLRPRRRAARVGVAVRLLDQALPFGGSTDPGLWPACARLLPHALAATQHAAQRGVEPLTTARLLDSAADYLRGRARYAEARDLNEWALALWEGYLGADHLDTAVSLGNLASIRRDQGDLDGARSLYERALAIYQARLGRDHPDTGRILSYLANVLADQGDLVGARSLHERALAIREARLGPDHPDIANSLRGLAGVLYLQGDLDGARQLHERALAIREARLGLDHPTTADSLNNLAIVLHAQGDLDGARQLYERVLTIREARLGPDHPTTADSLNNLANVLRDQGDPDAARQRHQRALSIYESRLGPDHPRTAHSLSNLAGVLAAQGDPDGGRQLYERALSIYESRLGPDHPATARSRQSLAALTEELDPGP